MDEPVADVRVLEVASHVFVPMAGSVLREWGAEVIKVEDPESGDPYRGLSTFGLHNVYRGVDPFFQSANRGKRSVAIDLKAPGGRPVADPARHHQCRAWRRRATTARRRTATSSGTRCG